MVKHANNGCGRRPSPTMAAAAAVLAAAMLAGCSQGPDMSGIAAERELMETRLLGTQAGLVQRNRGEGYDFEAELYLERNGAQYDMKLHPPVPGTAGAYHHFVDAIVNDKPHIATGEEGLVVMELLDAVYASAASGAPVRVGGGGH